MRKMDLTFFLTGGVLLASTLVANADVLVKFQNSTRFTGYLQSYVVAGNTAAAPSGANLINSHFKDNGLSSFTAMGNAAQAVQMVYAFQDFNGNSVGTCTFSLNMNKASCSNNALKVSPVISDNTIAYYINNGAY